MHKWKVYCVEWRNVNAREISKIQRQGNYNGAPGVEYYPQPPKYFTSKANAMAYIKKERENAPPIKTRGTYKEFTIEKIY